MNLSGIIAISGKSGLYKVVAQGKNNLIVELIGEKKRFPAYATDRISALEDISIYTYEDDIPLKEVYKSIFTKENGQAAPSHKAPIKELEAYLEEVLPNYDRERVYPSDIKKLYQWYNILQAAGELKLAEEATEVSEAIEEAVVVEEATEVAAEKAPKAKKTTKKAADTEVKEGSEEKPAKKPAAKKTTKKAADKE